MDTFPQQFDVLHLWYLGNPSSPSCVGSLHLEDDGDGVSLHYSPAWLYSGFPLSEDLPLVNKRHHPPQTFYLPTLNVQPAQ